MSSVPKTIGAYKSKKATDDAIAVLTSGVSTLESMERLLNDFPYKSNELSKAQKDFEESLTNGTGIGENPVLAKAIPPTRDMLASTITNIQTLEQFIMLSIPPMEDGNNFGVGVQRDVAKYLQETRELLGKKLEAIAGYYDSRANALEKLGLEKTASTKTTTTSESKSTGGEKGDENKTSSSTSTEEKSTGTTNPTTTSANIARIKHLASLDVKYYFELYTSIQEVFNAYAATLDTAEKNYEKLYQPKGSEGGRNMMSMF